MHADKDMGQIFSGAMGQFLIYTGHKGKKI